MRAIQSPRSTPVPGLFMLFAFCLPVMAGDLLRNDALESFREVGRWRGVESAESVPGQNELSTRGKGRILVNGTTKDTSIPYLLTKEEYGDEKVFVNGVLVQENATTSGPTRSSPLENDAAKGPIAIQGDHGPIAIRSSRVAPLEDAARARLAELDAYWAEVSRAVREGDFDAYAATCHPEGVLVSGSKQMSQPLATALARWKKDFIDTREGKVGANVEFRFSRRVGDATTAHESGVFRYTSQAPGAEPKHEWIRFEGLLVKRGGAWKILMENQIGPATEAEWDALK